MSVERAIGIIVGLLVIVILVAILFKLGVL